MTQNDFTITINNIDAELWRTTPNDRDDIGNLICDSMNNVKAPVALKKSFVLLLQPYDNAFIFWNDCCNKKNQGLRHIALEIFYQSCLSSKQYKEF